MAKNTVQQIINQIRKQLGKTWVNSPVDVLNTGNSNTIVTGITTSFSPTIDVLKRSIEAGNNLIITQQPAFYIDSQAPERDPVEEIFKENPTYLYKKSLIEENKLVIWRFYDNWNNRKEDGQLLGIAKALNWEKYHLENKSFLLPESTLGETVLSISKQLNIQGIRAVGDPSVKIKKAVISHGMFRFTELQEILKDPDVTLLVIAEAIEWESPEYFRDLLTWKGHNKGMILLGRQAMEDPGYGEVARWLQTFIKDIPIEWIPAEEPFWVPR